MVSRVLTRFRAPDREALLRPRSYPISERAVGDGAFESTGDAPVRQYRRTVTFDEGGIATQVVTFGLALPYFAWIFIPFFRHALRRPARDRPSWWLPPDRFDARDTTVLGTLCAAAVLFGYINTLFNQTIAFAADEFHANNAAQGVAGGFVRAGGVLRKPQAYQHVESSTSAPATKQTKKREQSDRSRLGNQRSERRLEDSEIQ